MSLMMMEVSSNTPKKELLETLRRATENCLQNPDDKLAETQLKMCMVAVMMKFVGDRMGYEQLMKEIELGRKAQKFFKQTPN